MTLTARMPRLRGHGQHRAPDRITALEGEIERINCDLTRALIAVAAAEKARRDANRGRDAANARAVRLAEEAREVTRLREENTRLAADLANATAVRPLPQHVDTVPGGIDVRPLWDAPQAHDHHAA